MIDELCTCPDACRYWCTLHERHHPVPGMVEFCTQQATPLQDESGNHVLVGQRCSCGEWEAALGESIIRGFDRHLIAVR